MAKSSSEAHRRNGVYYTPPELALRLVEPFAGSPVPATIFDPACGDGSLLFAATEVFKRVGCKERPDIYGCDLSPVTRKLTRLLPKRIWRNDFLRLCFTHSFDLVLMNPPFVRHHGIPQEIKQAYNAGIHSICALPKNSDLWAYFLVRAVDVVSEGGSVGAILPWAFLQADYARTVRAWLAERFEEIEVTAVSTRQFVDAEERIALVWLRSKGRSAQSIALRNVSDLCQDAPPCYLSWSEWLRARVAVTGSGPVSDVLSVFSAKGFVPFREVADTKIGTVTGADSFFVADRRSAMQLGLKEKDLQRIVKSLRNLGGLKLNGNCPDQVLMHFPIDIKTPQIGKYVQGGRRLGIHLRAHCLRRSPWYAIPRFDPPAAFFPYRASHTPYLILNAPGYICTNSIHAINWRKLLRREIGWVQVSMLSAPGQLSLEAHAKTYGSGVLKIEPNSLGSVLVTTGAGQLRSKVYECIDALLVSNKRDEASAIATDAIRDLCGIDAQTMQVCTSMLRELRQRRLTSRVLPSVSPGCS